MGATKRKEVIRILRFCIIGLLLLTIILFVLSIYTLFSGLMGAVSGDTFGLKLNKTSGDWSLTLDANPRNNGVLGERLSVQLGIIDSEGKYIAKNSESIVISPGGQSPFSVILTIPREDVQKYHLDQEQQASVVFEMIFSIRTLADLVGFTQTMRIAEGEAKL